MPLTTDQTPAETSAAQGSADYDGVEAICEISHELAEAFEKHERLQYFILLVQIALVMANISFPEPTSQPWIPEPSLITQVSTKLKQQH